MITKRSRSRLTDPHAIPPIFPFVRPALGSGPLANVEDDVDGVDVVLDEFVVRKIGR
jgi:hypothetical protein